MKKNGFTLVELVTVIILLGILSALALPRFFNKSTFEDSFDRSEFSNALAWVRNRSITSQCAHEVRLTTTGWTTFRDNSCSSQTVETGCSTDVYNFNVAVSDGANSAVANSEPTLPPASNPARLIFTSEGKLYRLNALPTTQGCTALPAASIPADTDINLSSGTLTIDGGTAYVSVQ